MNQDTFLPELDFKTLYNDLDSQSQLNIDLNISKDALNVKFLNMLYFKKKFESRIKPEMYRNKCVEKCYDNVDFKSISYDSLDPVNQLKSCAKNCNKGIEDLDLYFNNINFLALRKLKGCYSSCVSNHKSQESKRYDCMFECVSRLDRRYRDYWNKHKEKLLARHFNKINF